MWNGPADKIAQQQIPTENGAVICPAFERGQEPPASMESAR